MFVTAMETSPKIIIIVVITKAIGIKIIRNGVQNNSWSMHSSISDERRSLLRSAMKHCDTFVSQTPSSVNVIRNIRGPSFAPPVSAIFLFLF